MKLPEQVSRITLDKEFASAYPPLGFYPFHEYELGNGDTYGLYWPVGMEEKEPLVIETAHDGWEVVPYYSSLDSFFQHCKLALEEDGDEDDEDDEDEDDDDERRPVEPVLSTDGSSPLVLFGIAKESLKAGDVNRAIAALEQALVILPEYSDASCLLYPQYKRVGQHDSAIRMALRAFISPRAFGYKDVKVFHWLRSQKSCPEDMESDPIWINRAKLNGVYGGVKENSDYAIYKDAIESYIGMGQAWNAIILSMRYNELMSGETTSFQERNGYARGQALDSMRDIIQRAGGKSRDLR